MEFSRLRHGRIMNRRDTSAGRLKKKENYFACRTANVRWARLSFSHDKIYWPEPSPRRAHEQPALGDADPARTCETARPSPPTCRGKRATALSGGISLSKITGQDSDCRVGLTALENVRITT